MVLKTTMVAMSSYERIHINKGHKRLDNTHPRSA